MCTVSAIYDHYNPYFDPWVRPLTVVPYVPPPSLAWEKLAQLIADFRAALGAARLIDQLTGQPDCEDKQKAMLEEQVQALEERLAEIQRSLGIP